jgi:hypothetical protein
LKKVGSWQQTRCHRNRSGRKFVISGTVGKSYLLPWFELPYRKHHSLARKWVWGVWRHSGKMGDFLFFPTRFACIADEGVIAFHLDAVFPCGNLARLPFGTDVLNGF